jgi:hypothetical protein
MLSQWRFHHYPQDFRFRSRDFRRHRDRYLLRAPEVYLVVDRVNPGYEWVFEDPETIAVEKLNGTNINQKIRRDSTECASYVPGYCSPGPGY